MTAPTLAVELLDAARQLEAAATVARTADELYVGVDLPAADRLARLFRTAADVVTVAVAIPDDPDEVT